ncbi:aarF domain-containing kinase [Fistulifera solaris]|uniref:AarF domain-containing kinase n=1 Tax=Fistulifera solaris TaxID=1519565 RepID=A0A1Z5JTA5_FISSO|nr:aarF domain-containing kinase [Fistulifera solaris]|eukprot:GAX17169.1 aarF domain-containing kinase [Fistulifera solaris]
MQPRVSSAPVTSMRQSRLYSTVRDTSSLMQEMRRELAKNEDANLMMQALRGQNLNDDDTAVAGLEMRLVDIAPRDDDSLPFDYDPQALKVFFSSRPTAVVTRVLQLITVSAGFLVNVLGDQLLQRGKTNANLEVQRAAELRELITSLGPFFIKIGQALSIRPDILSPRSMVELQKLCDKVPSFDSKIAFATIERELGRPVEEIFSKITPEPVAAASLGQVYKATLRETGETVAVKVQRPAVLETVSLDLYLARELGMIARRLNLSDRLDAVALLDEFAYRFYQELDYNLECQNGERIAREMAVLPMVVIPKNYPKYTSRRVHVAEWIEGEKLSQSKADDVGALVNLGVITYLTQLLDSGFFHADPHPGNMMRTNDGRLAILDFGLMTEVTEDQKYGMIEAIVHLINRDYSEIGQDFINLDFIPKGTDTRPIVPALTKVFDVALAGGGAKSINFQDLAADLAEITFEYPFRIPPYFALVIRAISVLEGIALVGNPNFAIIDEAYPYIARRLMTDPSPRLRATLRYMIYGRDGNFDAENLIDLLQALEKFTAVRDDGDGSAFKVNGVRGMKVVGSAGDFVGSQQVDISERDTDVDGGRFRVSGTAASPVTGSQNGSLATASSETVSSTMNDQETVRGALSFFFGNEGDVLREFMLEEIVTVVDASGRNALQELGRTLGFNRLPIPVPSFIRAINPELSENDKRMVQQIGKLIEFLLGDFEGAATSARLRKLIPVVREYAPQLREFGLLLAARLTERSLSRGMNWASSQLQGVEAALATR